MAAPQGGGRAGGAAGDPGGDRRPGDNAPRDGGRRTGGGRAGRRGGGERPRPDQDVPGVFAGWAGGGRRRGDRGQPGDRGVRRGDLGSGESDRAVAGGGQHGTHRIHRVTPGRGRP